jgi:hypothetical protein
MMNLWGRGAINAFRGFSATVLGLFVAACTGQYPHYVAVQPQQTHTTCVRTTGETDTYDPCRPPRLAALSPVINTRMNGSASGPRAQPAIPPSLTVPVINVDQVCEGIANYGDVAFGDREAEKKHCLDTEQEVWDHLRKVWATFNSADRNHCVNETKMGGESSYTELLTCLEMAAAVEKMHEEADTAKNAETVGSTARLPQ